MIRSWITIAAALPLCASASDTKWQATLDGLGPVRIGMTIEEAENALGRSLTRSDDYDEGDSCTYYSTDPAVAGVAFMASYGRIVRYDVFGPNALTRSGVGVGDTVQRARQVYGAWLEVAPHFYGGPEASYLTLWSRDRGKALRFESLDGRIESFHGGLAEQVQYVEGCL